MASNREAAEESLKAIAMAGVAMTTVCDDPDGYDESVRLVMGAGILAALLDVADAIREQTAEIRARATEG
jgi:hypothetical protein